MKRALKARAGISDEQIKLIGHIDGLVAHALTVVRELNAQVPHAGFRADIALLDLMLRPTKRNWLRARAVLDRFYGPTLTKAVQP